MEAISEQLLIVFEPVEDGHLKTNIMPIFKVEKDKPENIGSVPEKRLKQIIK